MTVATTGQAMQKGSGWRKALRTAIVQPVFNMRNVFIS
jgi:hypothetical protein